MDGISLLKIIAKKKVQAEGGEGGDARQLG